MTDRYLLGELTETERELYEEHFFDCPSCSAEVKAAELMIRELEPGPAPVKANVSERLRDWWRELQWAPVQWAPVAASLLVSGWFGAQNWQLRHAPAFVAQAPTTIRPAARSGDGRGTITIPRSAERFVVMLDLDAPVVGARFEVRDAKGVQVESIPVTARNAVPLVLSAANYPDGTYEVLVPGSKLRYNFVVKR